MSSATESLRRADRGQARAVARMWPASYIFAFALALQLFHQLEHFVQVAQAKFLGIKPAHGILGSVVDLEWVHFVYNSGLLILLLLATVAVLRDRRVRPPVGWLFLGATLAVQTYHQLEHVAKIVQHVQTGADPAPGILGFVIDLVWLHFTINAVVTVCMIGAFYSLGLYQEVLPAGRAAAAVLVRPRILAIVGLVAVGLLAGIAIAVAR
jgi:hypothetical protein